ncbi:MAG: IS200/IS605 family transposase [Candidatus Aenigmarchaeota archaeon]|nr:IS200/IS605 family transposase [Candidatus Aenigmarchaeota archaeon]
MDIERAPHCTYRIRYHMVFVVKYRKHMLLEKVLLQYIKQIILEIGKRYWFKFEAIGVEEDHLHIVVGAPPRNSPSDIMRIVKSITEKQIFQDYPDIKEFLWGGNFWSAGGHIDTVSEYGGLDKIKKYVEEQGRDKNQLKLCNF